MTLRRVPSTAWFICSAALLSACAAMPAEDEPRQPRDSDAVQALINDVEDTRDAATIEAPDLSSDPAVFIGSDELAKLPPARPLFDSIVRR